MQLKIKHKGLVLVAVPLVFELIFIGALTHALISADNAASLARHSEKILRQLEVIDNSFGKLATTSMLYGFTRSEKKYNEYRSLRNDQGSELDAFQQLLSDDKPQQGNFDNLKHELTDSFAEIDNVVETLHSSAWFTALGTLHIPSVRKELSERMQRILAASSVIAELEHERNRKYTSGEKSARQAVGAWLIVAVVGNIAVCLALAMFFGRDITDRLATIVDNTFRLRARKDLRRRLSGNDEIAHLDKVFHEMSDELQATELKRQQLDALKRDFANMVSHDLRSPLMASRAFLENLSDGLYGKLTTDGQTTAENMILNLDRLLDLVNGLLNLEKMEDPNTEMHLQSEPVGELLHFVITPLQLLADGKQVRLSIAEVSGEVCIMADRNRIAQVLQNLVSNAIAFSPAGATVQVSCRAQDNYIEFRVQDEGTGIPEEQQQEIFDRFKQVESGDKVKAGGFGLGLAICRAIVEQHQGTIGVESQPGKGSTFWFRISSAEGSGLTAGTDSGALPVHQDNRSPN